MFKHKRPQPLEALNQASMLATEYSQALLAQRSTPSHSPTSSLVNVRRPPPRGVLKCNVDAAVTVAQELEQYL